MSKVILVAKTAADVSDQFFMTKVYGRKTICANGLSGAEVVTLQFKDGNGAWVSMASTYNLTATDPVKTIYGEGEYRLSKPVTVVATSLSLSGNS